MIDTLKRFWSAHWPKILSIYAVVVFVIGITFSCGLVNSKAYESFPDGYLPVNFEIAHRNYNTTYTFDANNLDPNTSMYTLAYLEGGDPNDILVIRNGNSYDATFGCPYDPPSDLETYMVHLNGTDLFPMYTSSSLSYDISYSPYQYVELSVVTPSADDEIAYIDVWVDVVTYNDSIDPDTGMYTYDAGTYRFQYTLPLVWDQPPVTVAEIIRSFSVNLPSTTVIEAVHLNLLPMYLNTELIDPDEHPNSQIQLAVSLSPIPLDISRSNFQLLRQRLNTLYGVTGDGSDGSYQQGYDVGYAEGKNVGLTQNLGITRWLTDAGDSVLGMRIFQVHTPHFVDGQYQPLLVDVTLGNILGVFLGGFLLIFILKMFAGG